MESHISGTMAGTGSFRCQGCGYVLTLTSLDALRDCPECGGHDFVRASLFNAAVTSAETHVQAHAYEPQEWLERAREELIEPGEYLLYDDGEESRTVALTREWTRIGRSLAADVRFDDPTVSPTPRARRASGRWRESARRPQPQRCFRQRRARGVAALERRRRDSRRPLSADLRERAWRAYAASPLLAQA